jgi:glutaredoxin
MSMAPVNRFFRPPSAIPLRLVSGLAILGLALSGCNLGGGAAAESYEQRLAEHLTEQDITMYGAYWCPHCNTQKELFGPAVKSIQYVECDPEGENAQPQLCRDKNIAGYPTWEIDGQLYPGTHSLEELAELSGFQE